MKNDQDIICNFYRQQQSDLPNGDHLVCKDDMFISCCPDMGVGDGLAKLSFIPSLLKNTNRKTVFMGNQKINSFVKYNPDYLSMVESLTNQNINARICYTHAFQGFTFNSKTEHLIHKISAGLNLEPQTIPKPTLDVSLYESQITKSKYKIGFHFSLAESHNGMRHAHPNPRLVYPENLNIFQEFINENNQYEFIEFGGYSMNLNNTTNYTNLSLEDSVLKIAECDFFIAVNSGFYHIAVALGIKTIMIVNLPKPENLILPQFVDHSSFHDLTWLYPQCVHLHQDGENNLVPKFSKESLKAAINGDVFPYWDNLYLKNLIEMDINA